MDDYKDINRIRLITIIKQQDQELKTLRKQKFSDEEIWLETYIKVAPLVTFSQATKWGDQAVEAYNTKFGTKNEIM